ncbi:MAG: zf-HC2 domain-containing protein [Pyrinomonadaceae bacterium]|nr:zf-HC2 domain-containing protein [Pyrinomonadaceae bacterium]
MAAHIPRHKLDRLAAHELAALETLQLKAHLHGCRECFRVFSDLYEQYNGFAPSVEDLSYSPLRSMAERHIKYDNKLTAFLTGKLADWHRAEVEHHLAVCSECAEKVVEIRQYIDSPAGEYVIAPATPQSSTTRAPMRQRFSSFLFMPGRYLSAPVGYSLAVAVILAIVAWFAIGDRDPNLANVAVDHSPPLIRNTEVTSPAPSIPPPPPAKINGGQRPLTRNEQANSNRQGQAHTTARKKQTPTSLTKRNSIPGSDNTAASGNEDESDELLLARNINRPPALGIFQQSAAVFRGLGSTVEEFSLTGPVSTLVKSVRPTLNWSALAGATTYAVSVFDSDLNLVEASGPIIATEWSVRGTLKSGKVYTWMVVAMKDGREFYAPAPPSRARFKVVDELILAQLNRRIEARGSAAARAVIYAEAGLLDDAEQELGSHLSLNPTDERARKLLQTIRAWRTGR